jgi:phospholipase A1
VARRNLHRENDVLVAYADDPNGEVGGFRDVENLEVKFQLSLRYRIAAFETHDGKLALGYTNTSFWQLFDWDESAPFRTTDHEPELFYEWRAPRPQAPMGHQAPNRERFYRLGVVHESNGEGIRLSRSWNRLFGEYLVASSPGACRQAFRSNEPKPGTCGVIKAWWNFQHDEINNGDIDKYMGNFELRGEHVWNRGSRPRLSLMLRNNLRSDGNRGAVRVDYDHNSNRIGLGFELTY